MRKQAGGWSKLPSSVREGVKKALEGETPFMLAPINWAAKKLLGEKKVNQAYWRYLQEPLIQADVNLGTMAQKATKAITRGHGGNFWTDSMLLPLKRQKGHSTGKSEYKLPSITAPVSKAGKLVLPILGAVKLEEMLKGKKMKGEQPVIKEADFKKVAEMLAFLKEERGSFKKEAKATELLYKQAELGLVKFPESFAEYREKVAELLGKDLNVVEEAIKMASSSEGNALGGLEHSPKKVDAQTAFQRAILD